MNKRLPWGKIIRLKKLHYSNEAIAEIVKCAATSVSYVIRNKHKDKENSPVNLCIDCNMRGESGFCYAQEDEVPPHSDICGKFQPIPTTNKKSR